MLLSDLVTTSALVGATSSRLEKTRLLAELLRRLEPTEVAIAIGFLTGWPRQGRLGVGWATAAAAKPPDAAAAATLTLLEVDGQLDELKRVGGKQSGLQRRRILAELLARSTADEQRFLFALMVGEVR
jgi:DNA ligase-1